MAKILNFYKQKQRIILSIEMIHCFFKFIWHTLAESHLSLYKEILLLT